MTTATAKSPAKKRSATAQFKRLDLQAIYDLAEQLEGAPVPGVELSEADFVAWCDQELRAEWVDGEVIVMAPVSDEHDDLNIWLVRLLGAIVESESLGALRQNIWVRLALQRRRRVPDLLFIAQQRSDLLKPTYLDGAPDLIIEIVSRDSQSRDRREKFQEYEQAGLREYWIIDPLSRSVEAYRLQSHRFKLIEDRNGTIASTVLPKLKLRSEWLWKKPLPKVSAVLKQLRIKS